LGHLDPLLKPALGGSEFYGFGLLELSEDPGEDAERNVVTVVCDFNRTHFGRTVEVCNFRRDGVAVTNDAQGPKVVWDGDQAAVGGGEGGVALIHDFIMAHFVWEVKGVNRPEKGGKPP